MRPFEVMSHLTLPHEVHDRLGELTLRQANGELSDSERLELDLLIEAREALAQVYAKASSLADERPVAPSSLGQEVRNGLPVVHVPPGTPPIDPDAVRGRL